MKFEISKHIKVVQTHDPDAYAAGAVNSSGIDTNGFEELLLIVHVGTLGSSATLDVKLQESSDDGSSDTYADITGAAVTQITQAGTDQSDNVYVARVNLSGDIERYVRVVQTVGTATSDCGTTVLLGSPGVLPVSQSNAIEFSVPAVS